MPSGVQRAVHQTGVLQSSYSGNTLTEPSGELSLWVWQQLRLLQLTFNLWEKTFQLAWSHLPTGCCWQSPCCEGIKSIVRDWNIKENFKYLIGVAQFRNLTMNGEAASLRCNCPKHLLLLPPWAPLKKERIYVKNRLVIEVHKDPQKERKKTHQIFEG